MNFTSNRAQETNLKCKLFQNTAVVVIFKAMNLRIKHVFNGKFPKMDQRYCWVLSKNYKIIIFSKFRNNFFFN